MASVIASKAYTIDISFWPVMNKQVLDTLSGVYMRYNGFALISLILSLKQTKFGAQEIHK